jgi:hypothetical protein
VPATVSTTDAILNQPDEMNVSTACQVGIRLPHELIEAIAVRAAEIVLATGHSYESPWMTRREAAEYLHLPVSRLEKDRTIPHHRDNGRVLYHRGELDAHFLSLGR